MDIYSFISSNQSCRKISIFSTVCNSFAFTCKSSFRCFEGSQFQMAGLHRLPRCNLGVLDVSTTSTN